MNNTLNRKLGTGSKALLDPRKKLKFFTLSVTSIFTRIHETSNIDKKITNCTV
jgi:hypothetical protein